MRRRLCGVGHAGHRRTLARAAARRRRVAGATARTAPGRAACAPRCTPASRALRGPLPDEHRGRSADTGARHLGRAGRRQRRRRPHRRDVGAMPCRPAAARSCSARFGAADAFYAPVAMRLRDLCARRVRHRTGLQQRLRAAPGVAAWIADALAEHDFIDRGRALPQTDAGDAAAMSFYVVGGAVRDELLGRPPATATGWWSAPRPTR